MIRAALATLLLAMPVFAEEKPLAPQRMLDRMVGRTMLFLDPETGSPVGYERFLDRTHSQWRRANGTCANGNVTTTETMICFRYDDSPWEKHCWLPYTDGPDIGYRSTATGERQLMRDAPTASVECTMDLNS